jgi:hypothetical protein
MPAFTCGCRRRATKRVGPTNRNRGCLNWQGHTATASTEGALAALAKRKNAQSAAATSLDQLTNNGLALYRQSRALMPRHAVRKRHAPYPPLLVATMSAPHYSPPPT